MLINVHENEDLAPIDYIANNTLKSKKIKRYNKKVTCAADGKKDTIKPLRNELDILPRQVHCLVRTFSCYAFNGLLKSFSSLMVSQLFRLTKFLRSLLSFFRVFFVFQGSRVFQNALKVFCRSSMFLPVPLFVFLSWVERRGQPEAGALSRRLAGPPCSALLLLFTGGDAPFLICLIIGMPNKAL